MGRVVQALSRALVMMFSPRVWLLIWKPALFSAVFWCAVVIAVGYRWGGDLTREGLSVQAWLNGHLAQWHIGQSVANFTDTLFAVLVVVLLALLLIVLMVVWAILLISLFGMKHINRLVAQRHFPQLAHSAGLSSLTTVWHSVKWTLWFALFWLLSVPAYFLAGIGALIQGGVVARYNQKIFTLDALADHATAEEFDTIAREHNLNLFMLGVAVTFLGALPAFIWIGSFVGAVLLPLTAMLSLLTFTALFVFCGLAYSCYCLQALSDLRARAVALTAPSPNLELK